MTSLRASIRRNPALAFWLFAAALALKALIPAGYMPGQGARTFDIIVCSGGAGGGTVSRQIVIPFEDGGGEAKHAAKGECAYAALAQSLILPSGPLLLAALLPLFAISLRPRPPVAPHVRPARRLRPPSQAPPAA